MRRAVVGALALLVVAAWAAGAVAQQARPKQGQGQAQGPRRLDPRRVAIDMDHILVGRVNRRGELVGLHHKPSAPATMRAQGVVCQVEFEKTSRGGPGEVVTARVLLRDPKSGRIVLQKNSTLYPAEWSSAQIEAAIREAFAEAQDRGADHLQRQVGGAHPQGPADRRLPDV